MTDAIALPTALQVLEQRLTTESTAEDLFQILRALQRIGLSREDLLVNLERVRAVNEVQADDPLVEENCLTALEMVSGVTPTFGLSWDIIEIARIHLAKWANDDEFQRAFPRALAMNDLLPPRSVVEVKDDVRSTVINEVRQRIARFSSSLQKADFYRVPKAGFTSRPAALLAVDDRIVYEALAEHVSEPVNRILSNQVLWPRGVGDQEVNHRDFSHAPETWRSRYVVVADIDSYYENISHSLLTLFLASRLPLNTSYLHSLEGLLRAIMGTETGLPQGPSGSEVFASAFLIPIDQAIIGQGWEFVRYADDFLIGADSIVDGRRKLEQLETWMRDVGLRLNPAKTKLMGVRTYLDALDRPSESVEKFREELRSIIEQELRSSSDPEYIENALRQLGTSDEQFWNLFYHQSTSLDDVIDDVRELLTPGLAESYQLYLTRVTDGLAPDRLPDNMLATERALKECLTFLASARQPVGMRNIGRLLAWFPKLSEHAAYYLSSVAGIEPQNIRDFLTAWLREPPDTDWATAWICHVMTRTPSLVDADLASVLTNLARHDLSGPLTRAESIRALAKSRQLDLETWKFVFDRSSAPVRSELGLTFMAEPELFPHEIGTPSIGYYSNDEDL